MTAASIPNDPTANIESFTTSPQNWRRTMRIRRNVSSTDQATEATAKSPAVAASIPSICSAIVNVTRAMSPIAIHWDWNNARRIPGSKRSNTVSESPIQPVWTALTVISTPNSRLNTPRPGVPSSRRATSDSSRLEAATMSCDSTAAIGRRLIVSDRRIGGRRRRRSDRSAAPRVAGGRSRGRGRRCLVRRSG